MVEPATHGSVTAEMNAENIIKQLKSTHLLQVWSEAFAASQIKPILVLDAAALLFYSYQCWFPLKDYLISVVSLQHRSNDPSSLPSVRIRYGQNSIHSNCFRSRKSKQTKKNMQGSQEIFNPRFTLFLLALLTELSLPCRNALCSLETPCGCCIIHKCTDYIIYII